MEKFPTCFLTLVTLVQGGAEQLLLLSDSSDLPLEAEAPKLLFTDEV